MSEIVLMDELAGSVIRKEVFDSKGIRRVRDAAYWGKPVGTPIVPGMKPEHLDAAEDVLSGMPEPKTPDELRVDDSERTWRELDTPEALKSYIISRVDETANGYYRRNDPEWREKFIEDAFGKDEFAFMLENNDFYASGNVLIRVQNPSKSTGNAEQTRRADRMKERLPLVFQTINELRDRQPVKGHVTISFSDGIMRALGEDANSPALGIAIHGPSFSSDPADNLPENLLVARFSNDRRDTIAFKTTVLTGSAGFDVEPGWWSVDNMSKDERTRYLVAHEWGHLIPITPIMQPGDKGYLSEYSKRNAAEETAEAFAAWFMDPSIGDKPLEYPMDSREYWIAMYASVGHFGTEVKVSAVSTLVFEDLLSGEHGEDNLWRYPEIAFDVMTTGETFMGDETKLLRHVRDSAYWGAPVGTPITPGMRPMRFGGDAQGILAGMPDAPETVTVESDDERIARRQDTLVNYARDEARKIDALIEELQESDFDAPAVDEALYDRYGVDPSRYNYSGQSMFVVGGDWLKFGACRDIREAAYDLLGYDTEDDVDESITADPNIQTRYDPGWGGGDAAAVAPYPLAYKIMEEVNNAPRADIPLWRGTGFYGYSVDAFVRDNPVGSTFDLPIASFVGNKSAAMRFGNGLVIRVQKGAKAVTGDYMGTSSRHQGGIFDLLANQDDDEDERIREYEDYEGELELSEVVTGGRFKVTHIGIETNGDDETVIVSVKQIATFDPDTGRAVKMENRRWPWSPIFNDSVSARVDPDETKVQRHVRDAAYWGAPVGTPLPLPPKVDDDIADIPVVETIDMTPPRPAYPRRLVPTNLIAGANTATYVEHGRTMSDWADLVTPDNLISRNKDDQRLAVAATMAVERLEGEDAGKTMTTDKEVDAYIDKVLEEVGYGTRCVSIAAGDKYLPKDVQAGVSRGMTETLPEDHDLYNAEVPVFMYRKKGINEVVALHEIAHIITGSWKDEKGDGGHSQQWWDTYGALLDHYGFNAAYNMAQFFGYRFEGAGVFSTDETED